MMRRLYRRAMCRFWQWRVEQARRALAELGEGMGWEYVYAKGAIFGRGVVAQGKVVEFSDDALPVGDDRWGWIK